MAIAVGRRSYALPQIFFAWNLSLPQWCMCWIHINNILISKSIFWGLLWGQWKPPPPYSYARNMLMEETENLLQDELYCYELYSIPFFPQKRKNDIILGKHIFKMLRKCWKRWCSDCKPWTIFIFFKRAVM